MAIQGHEFWDQWKDDEGLITILYDNVGLITMAWPSRRRTVQLLETAHFQWLLREHGQWRRDGGVRWGQLPPGAGGEGAPPPRLEEREHFLGEGDFVAML